MADDADHKPLGEPSNAVLAERIAALKETVERGMNQLHATMLDQKADLDQRIVSGDNSVRQYVAMVEAETKRSHQRQDSFEQTLINTRRYMISTLITLVSVLIAAVGLLVAVTR